MKKKQIIYLLILLLIFTSCREDYYENGKILYENGDFENALINLKEVREKDKHYIEAQKLIQKSDSLFEVQLKEKARLDNIKKIEAKLKQVKIDSLEKVKAIKDNSVKTEIFQKAKDDYHKTLSLRKKYIGFKYEYPKSTDFIKKYGSPKTLNGTDNNKWIVYFSKGDFTVVSNKKTNKFENIYVGKHPNLKYDVTLKLSKLIGKKMKYYDYNEKVSSIKYGSTETLGMTNCVNEDCIEYHHKGNFTTVAFFEFNDKGDFVTLKKIAIGKVPRLNEY